MIITTFIFVIGILLTLLIVVGFHEFGHFAMAKLLRVKVLCFSVGFGKALFHLKDKSGTKYQLAILPLGGYVKLAEERQPLIKRFLIIIAGPLSNFILAFFLYWIIFSVGFTTIKPIIGEVLPDSIAKRAALKSQQEIIQIDEQKTSSWIKVMMALLIHTSDSNTVVIKTKNPAQKEETHQLDLTHWHLD